MRTRYRVALIALLLQFLLLNSGCIQPSYEAPPDLIELQGKLIHEFRHRDIYVVIQNPNDLVVSLVNSRFNELDENKKKDKAEEIAVFVNNNFGPIKKVERVLISFVTSETYVFIFQYSQSRTFQFDKKYLVNAGMVNKPAENVIKANAIYSEPQNTTTVLVNNLLLDGDLSEGLILIPSFIIRGKKIVAPESVILEFASYDKRKMFADNRNVTILVDGKAVAKGAARLVSSGVTADGKVSEFLTYELTYEQFLQLINGQEVQLNLGPKEIKLKAKHLRLLRQMKECVDASKCS